MTKPYVPTPPFNADEYLRQALNELARLDGLAYTGEVRRLIWLARTVMPMQLRDREAATRAPSTDSARNTQHDR